MSNEINKNNEIKKEFTDNIQRFYNKEKKKEQNI